MNEEEIIKVLNSYTTDLYHSYKGDIILKAIKGLLDLYNKEKASNKEWFDIADNILRATNKYGDISIGEIPKYIIELQTKLELEKIDNKYNKEETSEEMIPKYVIRNKIKELEEDVKDFEDYWSKDPRKFKKEKSIDYYKLEVLKELLGDDDNE